MHRHTDGLRSFCSHQQLIHDTVFLQTHNDIKQKPSRSISRKHNLPSSLSGFMDGSENGNYSLIM